MASLISRRFNHRLLVSSSLSFFSCSSPRSLPSHPIARPLSQVRLRLPSTPSNTDSFFLSSHENPRNDWCSSYTFTRSIVSHGQNPKFLNPSLDFRLPLTPSNTDSFFHSSHENPRNGSSSSHTFTRSIVSRGQKPKILNPTFERWVRLSKSENPSQIYEWFETKENRELVEEMNKNMNNLIKSLIVLGVVQVGFGLIQVDPDATRHVVTQSLVGFGNSIGWAAYLLWMGGKDLKFLGIASRFAVSITFTTPAMVLIHATLGRDIAEVTGLTPPWLIVESVLAAVFQLLLLNLVLRAKRSVDLQNLGYKLMFGPWNGSHDELKALNCLLVRFIWVTCSTAALSSAILVMAMLN